MDITTLLPSHPGYLPKWLLFVSLTSLLNSLQSYTTLAYTRRIYSRSPASVTSLSARTFGTWTALSAIVRFYAAYNITDPAWYQVAFATYAVAWLHFVSEWVVFGTAGWGVGLAGPVVVSTGTGVWMWVVWGSYVG